MSAAAEKQTGPSVYHVHGKAVEQVWPKLYEMVAPACDETITPAVIAARIYHGKAIAWCVVNDLEIRAVMVTEVRIGPAGDRWIEVVTLGGKGLDEWDELLAEALERHRLSEDVEFCRTYARPGMAKILGKRGWRERKRCMEWRGNG